MQNIPVCFTIVVEGNRLVVILFLAVRHTPHTQRGVSGPGAYPALGCTWHSSGMYPAEGRYVYFIDRICIRLY